jgi:hypothetical protein
MSKDGSNASKGCRIIPVLILKVLTVRRVSLALSRSERGHRITTKFCFPYTKKESGYMPFDFGLCSALRRSRFLATLTFLEPAFSAGEPYEGMLPLVGHARAELAMRRLTPTKIECYSAPSMHHIAVGCASSQGFS